MYLVINKWVIAVKVSKFSGQYLRNHWTLDIGVLGCIGIVWPKEHSPEVWHIPPGTPCIYIYNYVLYKYINLKFSKNGKLSRDEDRSPVHCHFLLLTPLQQRLIDATSFRLSKSLYSRSVLFERSNSFSSVFQNRLHRRIYENKLPTHVSCNFFFFLLSLFVVSR